MLLTLPTINKGIAATISLSKADLFALSAVATDPYFSIQSNVAFAIAIYDSAPGNQREVLKFDLSQASPSASFLVSDRSRDTFELVRVILEDFDGGTLSIERDQLPVGLDVLMAPINEPTPTISYSGSPFTFTKGTAISPISPTATNAAIYSISPALPTGLSLSTSTGVISGTPTGIFASAIYTITASNNTGQSASAVIGITVNDIAPSSLIYSVGTATYTKGVAITENTPSYGGGTATSWSVAPALPSGLSLNSSTGVISGTPTALSAQASFTVTATNSGGSTSVFVSITVNDVAPSALSYSLNTATYTVGSAITVNSPTSSGGAVTSYSVSPALPAGLSLNTSTGVISGTPTTVTAQGSFTITASNTGGSTTRILSFTVNDVAPSALTYSLNTATYTVGTAITTNSPSSSGGVVTSYSVSPALPAGLSLNTSSGLITGTPTTVTAQGSYTITATNSGGSTTRVLTFTVNAVAPSALSYTLNTATYTVGTAITTNSPTSSGGAVTSYSVSPALPAGLSLNTTTGVITGTPTTATAQGTYTVTATNSGGSTTRALTFTVQAAAVTTTLSLASVSPTAIPGNQPFTPQVIRVTFSEPVKVNSNFYTKILHLGVARYTNVQVPGFYYNGPFNPHGDEQIYTAGGFNTAVAQSEANAINFNSFYTEITIYPITRQNNANGVLDQAFNLLAGVGVTADGRSTAASNTVLVDVVGDNNS